MRNMIKYLSVVKSIKEEKINFGRDIDTLIALVSKEKIS